jgi:hypothetical protein
MPQIAETVFTVNFADGNFVVFVVSPSGGYEPSRGAGRCSPGATAAHWIVAHHQLYMMGLKCNDRSGRLLDGTDFCLS